MKNGIHNLLFMAGKKAVSFSCQVKNGFRDRVTRLQSFTVTPGWQLFFMALILCGSFAVNTVVGVVVAGAVAIKLKKDGLEGAELKFMTDLEKRFEGIEVTGLTAEEVTRLHAKAIEEALEPYKRVREISMDKIVEILDEKTGLKAILKTQGEEIAKLKLKGVPEENEFDVRTQVKMWVEKNKETIDKMSEKSENRSMPASLPELRIRTKAAITMLESASLGGSAYLPNVQVLPGVINLIRLQPTFWDRLQKGATRANPLVWVNKHNKQGNAVFTAEGALKTQASFELLTETSTPKKVAEFMKVSTEMLSDIDYLVSVINGELQYEVDKASNDATLVGTGVGANPKGVTLYGAAYSLANLNGIIAANNTDAIRAAIAMLRSLNFNGALTAYINPVDAAQRDLAKALTGQYANSDQVRLDCTVVEDNNIPIGYLLIGDMSKYHVMMYQDFTITWGLNNDDFTKNLITVIGERRFHQWVADNEKAAFVYDTFANIRAAIS